MLTRRLTEGKVHVCHAAGFTPAPCDNTAITYNRFSGPHPAGLLAGPQVSDPMLLRTRLGASLTEFTAGKLKLGDNRVISGSVLSGRTSSAPCDYLGRFHQQVSVLLEGRDKELFGWIMPGRDKFSLTRTTLGHFCKNKLFSFSTNMNGGKRAMVPIGNYERIMPLDILATHLLRDLLAGDTDRRSSFGVFGIG